jgi:hypothetical protein
VALSLVWQAGAALALVITQIALFLVAIVLLPLKAIRWLVYLPSGIARRVFARRAGSSERQAALEAPSLPHAPAVASGSVTLEPNVSLTLVRVREVLIREITVVQISRGRDESR